MAINSIINKQGVSLGFKGITTPEFKCVITY